MVANIIIMLANDTTMLLNKIVIALYDERQIQIIQSDLARRAYERYVYEDSIFFLWGAGLDLRSSA